jgi:putative phosphoesterase
MKAQRIGVISDTHGLLRPEATRALAGVAQIIHAGDIGGEEIIDALRAIAPVHAVRGNNDKGAWARKLPLQLTLEFAGVRIFVLHNMKELDLDPAVAGLQVVISGHSHMPGMTQRDGILFLNPGSAGPRRFKLPVSVASLTVAHGMAQATIQRLL